MKVLILHSDRPEHEDDTPDPYTQAFSNTYALRVIGNLKDDPGFCGSCGPDCAGCRAPYGRKTGDRIAGILRFPGRLPYVLESPAALLPDRVPPHDVALAIHIHEQVLVAFLRQAPRWGTRALIAPQEAGGWVSHSARRTAMDLGRELGIEVAFPKPFCGFDPPEGSLLAAFRRTFHIGKPEVRLEVRNGVVERAFVEVSAACGATYFIAHGIEGRRVDDDLRYEVIAKRLHAYPCTASMAMDDELGDTPLHVAGDAHYEILEGIPEPSPEPVRQVMSPLGKMVQEARPVSESIENVEQAKRIILRELDAGRPVSLDALTKDPRTTPAALYTALLALKREGRIKTEGHRIENC